MSEKIIIKGLKVPTIIGVHQWEQAIKQTLILDLELDSPPFREIANYDDIEQALDYQKVAEWIHNFGSINSFKLIETFASKLADSLANEFNIRKIAISLEKHQAIDDVKYVGVKLERDYNC